jgi:hypothetical protein
MAVLLKRGKTKFVYLPVTTSTAFTNNTFVSFSGGLLTVAAGTSGSATSSANIIGVIRKAIASTDSDYATARMVPVEVPCERFTEWDIDVNSGSSLVVADILTEVDLYDQGSVNRGSTTTKVVRCVGVYSTTKGRFFVKFQGSY